MNNICELILGFGRLIVLLEWEIHTVNERHEMQLHESVLIPSPKVGDS